MKCTYLVGTIRPILPGLPPAQGGVIGVKLARAPARRRSSGQPNRQGEGVGRMAAQLNNFWHWVFRLQSLFEGGQRALIGVGTKETAWQRLQGAEHREM